MATNTKKTTVRAKRVSTVPKDEAKDVKFHRLAKQRVGAALNKLVQIGNLSGSNYDYTEEDVTKIATALSDQLKAVLLRFQPKKPGERRSKATFDF